MVLPNRAQALPFILLNLLNWYSHFLFQVWPYILVYLVNLCFSYFFNIELGEFYPFKPKVAKVLFLGQDMAYKKSVLLKLFDEPSQYMTSCVSSIGGIKFNFFDLGEHSIARRVWRDYCAKMDAVVYIVKANTRNREQFLGPREELNALLSDEAFANVPFLIFCITTAEPSSFPEEELCSLLDLNNITTGNGRVDLADANARPLEVFVAEFYNERQYLDGFERAVSELVFAKSGPTVILLAGLQGVGKTTVCAKLAYYLKKQGKSCMLVAGDVYRPAAIDQLVILGEQVNVPVYAAGTEVKPSEIAKKGLEEAKKKNIDVVIMDTAGRLQIDKGMMDELKEVKRALNPTEVLLVVDAMTGQEAAALVTTFNLEIGITGAILTKLDGDSRGGAALSVKEVSGKPIKLVGRGERMEDLEPFYPDRMAGRILGMGDVLSFVEKAQEVMKQEDAEELQKKIMSAKFDFNDFLKQTRAVARMGSMTRVLGMIPGMGKVTPAQIREAEKSLKIMEGMIEAMTPEEREKPELLAESPVRRKRVAQESGKTEQQVNQLVAQLFQMRVRMKNLMGVMEGGSIPALSNLEEAIKSEQKAPPGTARRKRRSDSRKKFVDATSTRSSPRGFGAGN